jgi:hypothetical protein
MTGLSCHHKRSQRKLHQGHNQTRACLHAYMHAHTLCKPLCVLELRKNGEQLKHQTGRIHSAIDTKVQHAPPTPPLQKKTHTHTPSNTHAHTRARTHTQARSRTHSHQRMHATLTQTDKWFHHSNAHNFCRRLLTSSSKATNNRNLNRAQSGAATMTTPPLAPASTFH